MAAVKSEVIDVLLFSINPCYDLQPASEDVEQLWNKEKYKDNRDRCVICNDQKDTFKILEKKISNQSNLNIFMYFELFFVFLLDFGRNTPI